MSEYPDAPIHKFVQSVAGTGQCFARHLLSEGRYEVLDMCLVSTAAYAQKAMLAYNYIYGDQSTQLHVLKTGWAMEEISLSLEGPRIVTGPCQMIGVLRLDESATFTITLVYRRLQP